MQPTSIAQVNRKIGGGDRYVFFVDLDHPAQNGAETGQEPLDSKRFGQLVVGAGVERGDLVPFVTGAGDRPGLLPGRRR